MKKIVNFNALKNEVFYGGQKITKEKLAIKYPVLKAETTYCETCESKETVYRFFDIQAEAQARELAVDLSKTELIKGVENCVNNASDIKDLSEIDGEIGVMYTHNGETAGEFEKNCVYFFNGKNFIYKSGHIEPEPITNEERIASALEFIAINSI